MSSDSTKRLRDGATDAVLIPLEQGMSSDMNEFKSITEDMCLNPFGTGHVFRPSTKK